MGFTFDIDVKLSHFNTGLDTAAKCRELQSLQLAPRLRQLCAGITFEGRVAFFMKFQGINLSGKTFGRLTVIRLVSKTRSKNGTPIYHWECKCECGTVKTARGDDLRRGNSKSCGCLGPEVTSKRSLRHGEASCRTRLYSVWLGMMNRCRIKIGYVDRGITVCERWKKYENFKADMESSYVEGLTIERVNNDSGYSPENCVWASRVQQQNNTRNNVRIEFNGKSMTIAQWSRETGLSHACLSCRLQMGWPISDVLFKPKQIHKMIHV